VRQEIHGSDARVGVAATERTTLALLLQLLLHLGRVAVSEHAVGPDALVDLGEEQIGLGLAAGPRDAALGIDGEIADQPGPCQRARVRIVAVG